MTSPSAPHQVHPGGRLTTHVLDTSSGRPAANMHVTLYRHLGEAGGADPWQRLSQARTNADGRLDQPLLQGGQCQVGRYRLVFDVASYFKAQGQTLPEPPFLSEVPLDFGLADPQAHYHVPLLVSPWAFSTYRGS